jgi:hypothetical protein
MARRVVDLPPGRAGVALSAAAPDAVPFWKEFFVYRADFVGAVQLPAGVANADPTALAGGSFLSFPIKIQSDADFEWLKTLYTFTDPRVYARFQDDSSGRRLHRSTLDLRLAAGIGVNFAALAGLANIESTGFLPFIEPGPYTIAAGSTFTIDAADFSGLANTVRIAFHGNKVRPGYAPWERDEHGAPRGYRARVPFKLVLPVDGQTMAVNANQTVNLAAPMDMEGDFLVHRVTGLHTGSALVQLQDGSGRDRFWSDAAVDFASLVGNGLYPMILPSPRFVYRGSSIQAQIQDTSGATNRLKLIFHGEKLYA